ncbi:hypothetical protein IscW_ISCW012486 [Ixodes scapularis]|uniref:Uncharacterized protein n=1 Tax=Ixodes scapularis TaxID=6945 RepID=B7QCJ4_IXOSC|nr:hypothetical protein IscW_ISCW012486 [Ixodes scapularis]|eukprot:XP_002413258.1 hypothetical protein IscW_ISCW012486 [Ixodes scapularis]
MTQQVSEVSKPGTAVVADLQSPASGGLSLDALLRRDTAQYRKDKALRLVSSQQQKGSIAPLLSSLCGS